MMGLREIAAVIGLVDSKFLDDLEYQVCGIGVWLRVASMTCSLSAKDSRSWAYLQIFGAVGISIHF